MEIPYTVNARRDTGLFNSKVGIWLFLASEVMLFGGLFSGYVFLRVGVRDGIDVAWPNGLDIQNYWLGFINTLVLIFSSVLVVMAWASLKLRNWRQFQIYMGGVLVCALAFMCIKAYEYAGKFTHHGVRLTDGTLVDGMFVNSNAGEDGDAIVFRANAIAFGLNEIDTYFLDYADPEADMRFSLDGTEVPRGELISALKEYREANPGNATVLMDLQTPVDFTVKSQDLPRRQYYAESIPFYGSNAIHGELVRDSVILEVHDMDFQLVEGGGDESAAWDLKVHRDQDHSGDTLGAHHREAYGRYVEHQMEEFADWVAKGNPIPASEIGLWRHLHDPGEHHGEGAAGHDAHGADHAEPEHEPEEYQAYEKEQSAADEDKGAVHGGEHVYPVVEIPRDMIRFMSSHGPSFSTYHAIYFTMTALHGLHVIGGALVLGYFLFFGKKLYLKNPEHMANRVEVGGLFWHFVDLVWIFLFPIMYLL